MKTVSHFIDGKIYSDNKSRKGPIFNPAIGEQIAEVELASKITVEKAIENYSFSDADSYEVDFSLDYDGKVMCESHEFINGSDLVQMIADKVCMLFKEADCPEDDNSQVNTQTVAEKII